MKVRKQDIIYGVIFSIIVFNNIFTSIIPIMGYFDEIVLAFFLIYILVHIRVTFRNSLYRRIFITTIGIVILGLVGNIAYSYQTFGIAIFKDVIAFLKMPIVAIGCALWRDRHNTERPMIVANFLSRIYLNILLIFGIISLFVDVGMSYDFRHGIASYRFLFTHPTFLVLSVVFLSAVVVSNGLKHRDYIYIFEALIMLILSMRDKGFAYAGLLFVLVIIAPLRNKVKKRYFLIAAISAIIVSMSKLTEYANWTWSPRFGLYSNGIRILREHFPIGSGFATFSTYVSGEYYAGTYYKYGFYGRYAAVNPDNYADLGDAGLPYLAEFGVVGIVLFLIMTVVIVQLVIKKYRWNNAHLKAAFLCIGYIAIASLVENIFTNESGTTIMMVVFLFLGRYQVGQKSSHIKLEKKT